VFDDWYCSVPAYTDPNRAFAMAGTSLGQVLNFNGTLWNQQSYFEYLRQNGHTYVAKDSLFTEAVLLIRFTVSQVQRVLPGRSMGSGLL
jgi:uncharacterized protein YfdQ (DUF2303 family)